MIRLTPQLTPTGGMRPDSEDLLNDSGKNCFQLQDVSRMPNCIYYPTMCVGVSFGVFGMVDNIYINLQVYKLLTMPMQ